MYDVFISYSTENQAEVELIRQRLEDVGISCWFAPKEIRGHEDFTKVIPQAIRQCRAFLLLMSNSAQQSKWVFRELGEADACDLPLYTLFLEDCPLEERFQFILRFSQHYKADDGLQNQLNRLIRDLRKLLSGEEPQPKQPVTEKKKKPLWPWLVACGALVAAAVVAVLLMLGGGDVSDGKYVIWVPDYRVALSAETAENAHYHAGEQVQAKNGSLTDYSQSCVWQLTFRDDTTFTISRDGVTLGVIPGYNGIGLGGEHTQDLWELVAQEDGTYRIRNVDSGYFLQWYAAKNNWVIHDKITDSNQTQFAISLEPVK